MNSRQRLVSVANWLGFQDEDLSAKLRNAFDALRLYDYAEANCYLPEMADEWEPEHRKAALGYDPLEMENDIESDTTGASEAADALRNAYVLLDSVAFVKNQGDTLRVLPKIAAVLSA